MPPIQRKVLAVNNKIDRPLFSFARFWVLVVLVIPIVSFAQTADSASQLLLDNDSVRVVRITLPAQGSFSMNSRADTVVVRLQDETATFITRGTPTVRKNAAEHEAVDLVVELKRHWDTAVRPCSEPMKCTRETLMGGEAIAWTTTLFTNGFLTGVKHKVVRGGTLDSLYYSAKGSNRMLVIPFTAIKANFGGVDEELKPGQPYFTTAPEVEVMGADDQGRWFVLRLNIPDK